MKKFLVLLILGLVLVTAGCGNSAKMESKVEDCNFKGIEIEEIEVE